MENKKRYLQIARLDIVLRIFTPFILFFNPVSAIIVNTVMDSLDHAPFRFAGYTRLKYQPIDKTLDFWWYTVALVYGFLHLPYFMLLLSFFLIRFIGQLAFYATRDEKYFIIFPAFFEFFFIVLVFVNNYPGLGSLMEGESFLRVLVGILVIKTIQELIAHKFDRLYYPYVPEWVKAPE